MKAPTFMIISVYGVSSKLHDCTHDDYNRHKDTGVGLSFPAFLEGE